MHRARASGESPRWRVERVQARQIAAPPPAYAQAVRTRLKKPGRRRSEPRTVFDYAIPCAASAAKSIAEKGGAAHQRSRGASWLRGRFDLQCVSRRRCMDSGGQSAKTRHAGVGVYRAAGRFPAVNCRRGAGAISGAGKRIRGFLASQLAAVVAGHRTFGQGVPGLRRLSGAAPRGTDQYRAAARRAHANCRRRTAAHIVRVIRQSTRHWGAWARREARNDHAG